MVIMNESVVQNDEGKGDYLLTFIERNLGEMMDLLECKPFKSQNPSSEVSTTYT